MPEVDAATTGVGDAMSGWLKGLLQTLQEFTEQSARAFRNIVARPFYWGDTFLQMNLIGVGSLPIVVLPGSSPAR